MEGELHKESIFCDAQLLTTHTLSAKGPTLNCDSRVYFGRASFVDRSKHRHARRAVLVLKRDVNSAFVARAYYTVDIIN